MRPPQVGWWHVVDLDDEAATLPGVTTWAQGPRGRIDIAFEAQRAGTFTLLCVHKGQVAYSELLPPMITGEVWRQSLK